MDILLALTGGPLTIELDDLDRAIEEIEPSIVIPMHYKIPCLRLGILPLEAFTTRYPQNVVESPTLEGSVSGASSILDTLTFYVR